MDNLPKFIAVQTINCSPLYKSFKEKLNEIPKIVKRDTIAEGIAIAEPIRGKQIIEAVKKSGGDFIAVTDAEIKYSLKDICKKGFYIEPTSAATIAGVEKYLEKSSDNVIVSVFTGHGLKTTEKMIRILDD